MSIFSRAKKRVYVSCCSNRNPEWPTVLSIQDSMRYAATRGFDITFRPRVGESLICRARQNDIVDFMRRDYDFLMYVDDDIVLPSNSISHLAEADKDIVAGVYRLKQDSPSAAVRLPATGGPNWGQVLSDDLLTEAEYVSTGCFMIKRSTVEGMIKHFPEQKYRRNVAGDEAWALFQPYVLNMEYLSEDWAFCQRALDAGFKVWVHGGIKCDHWGKKNFRFGEV